MDVELKKPVIDAKGKSITVEAAETARGLRLRRNGAAPATTATSSTGEVKFTVVAK
jgi:hypothetical protein